MELPSRIQESYELLRLLGEGSYGSVHLARDRALDREVAVKILRTKDPAQLERFRREAGALARLNHPGIVKVYDHGVDGEVPFLVMEYVEGVSLEKRPPLDDPLEVMLQVASALEEVHRAGLVHRDIKPANVLLAEDGRALLTDFGLMLDRRQRTLTRTGMVVGTPIYMAPERLNGATGDPAADWFSWGATLYFLVEGKPPYTTKEVMHWAVKGRSPPFEFEKVPPDDLVAMLIRRCMSARREERPQSRRAVERVLDGLSATFDPRQLLPEKAAPSPHSSAALDPLRSAELEVRRFPRGVLAAWAFLAVLGLGALGWTRGGTPPEPEPAPPAPPAPVAPTRAPGVPPDLVPVEPDGRGNRRYRNQRDGSLMVMVPAGPFPARTSRHLPLPPPRTVELPTFFMDVFEVDDVRMARFLEETGTPPPGFWENQRSVDHAAVHSIDWDTAREYCAWAGGRLPRALEWEKAAVGPTGRRYPWGNEPPDATRAKYVPEDLGGDFVPFFAAVKPVGSYPAGVSIYGIHDLAGNVAEWVEEESLDPASEVDAKDGQEERVSRGGSWAAVAEQLPSALYRRWARGSRDQTQGFRCVRDPE